MKRGHVAYACESRRCGMGMGALCPSKSGLIHNHVVNRKHIGYVVIASHLGFGTCCGSCRANVSFFVPCSRPSPDKYTRTS